MPLLSKNLLAYTYTSGPQGAILGIDRGLTDNDRMTDPAFIEQLRQTAHQAVWRAGQVIRDYNDRPRSVRFKGPRDLVTDTDTAAQLAAVKVITDRFPDHRIIAEEDPRSKPGKDNRWQIPRGVVWMIDPLDGTSNYASHVPLICVSVGVAVDGEPVAGAIFDPLRDELFTTAAGQGATLNGRPVEPIRPVALENAIISLDWAREPAVRDRILAGVITLAPHCRTLRALGSAALALAYVAAGRLQVYFNYNLQPWDTAAGAAMIREVGGEIRSPDGSPWQAGESSLVAGHPELLDAVIALINQAE